MATKSKKSDRERLAERFGSASPLRVLVVTLSDRAAAGVYEDKGGPLIRRRLEEFFDGSGVALTVETVLLSDDAEGLREQLVQARNGGVHAVFTTGGTGVGPRDNTPEVVLDLADKVIPGIMELIRMKYGADKPCALLSRTVAAMLGQTVVYTMPGSTKGVEEYLAEILKTFEHLLCVVHALEVH